MILIRSRVLGVAMLVAGGACAQPADVQVPDVPPPPELSYDSLVIGDLVLNCGEWLAEVPTVQGWTTLDLFVPRSTPSHPYDRPLPEAVKVFTDRGATVIHEFNFPAIRAVLPIAGLERLYPEALSLARAVPFSDRFDLKVGLVFRAGSEEDWRGLISSAGGIVTSVVLEYRVMFAIVPDDSAPAIRANELVETLELNGQLCHL